MKALLKTRLIWIMVLFLMLFGGWACLYYIRGVGQPAREFRRVGPVQVLANDHECWVFVEADIFVAEPGLIPRDHSAIRVGCTQSVTVISKQGVIREIDIPRWKEVTFHRNLSRIFRYQDGFYLVGGDRLSLYIWNQDHFHLLPLTVSDPLIQRLGIQGPIDPALDRITENDGWKHLYSQVGWGLEPETFTWLDTTFTLEVTRTPRFATLWLYPSPHRPWEAVVMKVDESSRTLSSEEYYLLTTHREPGHHK